MAYQQQALQKSKIQILKTKIDDVKDVMVQNIDAVLQRQNQLHDLIDSTDELANNAQTFNRSTRKAKCQQLFGLICLIAFIVIFLVTMALFSVTTALYIILSLR